MRWRCSITRWWTMSLSSYLTLERLEATAALLCGPVMAYEYYRWHKDGGVAVLVVVSFLTVIVASNIVRGFKVALTESTVGPNGVRDVVKRLERDVKDEEKVRQLASKLQALLSGSEGAEAKGALVRCGGVEAIARAVQHHPQSQATVNKCLAALLPLLSCPEGKAKLQASLPFLKALVGVVDGGLTTMTQHKASGSSSASSELLMADVARQCCLLIGACVDGQRALQTKVANAGAIDAILRAMALFPAHTELQKWAFFALFNLTYEHGGTKVLLVGSGGLQRLLTAMRAHLASVEIQRLGVACLYSVLQLRNDSEARWWEEDEEEEGRGSRAAAWGQVGSMRAVALSNGLLDTIASTLKTHVHDAEMQSMGTQLLAVTSASLPPLINQRPRPSNADNSQSRSNNAPHKPITIARTHNNDVSHSKSKSNNGLSNGKRSPAARSNGPTDTEDDCVPTRLPSNEAVMGGSLADLPSTDPPSRPVTPPPSAPRCDMTKTLSPVAAF